MNPQIEQIIRASVHHFVGRLGRDPELRFFESGNAVANCRLLINLPGAKKNDGQDPDAFKLELWGDKAQAFADGCRKGSLVQIIGRVKQETWTDRTTGEERSQPVISVERWELLQPGPNSAAPAQAAPAPAPAQRPVAPAPAVQQRVPF